ncbi:MAG: hypothetical protein HPY54_15930 [Chthonomonadetes bacterium]|nr:hypothetical protein [Chthonomonadetes bacterium]
MNNGYSVARLIEDTCPRCGRNLVLRTAVNRTQGETRYIQQCPSRKCGYRKTQRVFKLMQVA